MTAMIGLRGNAENWQFARWNLMPKGYRLVYTTKRLLVRSVRVSGISSL
jgi:hypothetical protein